MKILWITPLFPYPLYSGGQVRAYNLLKSLSDKAEVTLFSFLRPNRDQGPVAELEKFCRVVVFPGRKTWTVRNVLLAGFSPLPFAVCHFWGNTDLKRMIGRELRNGGYDLVHFESFYTSPYLRSDFPVKTVLGNENVEFQVYRRFVQHQKKLLRPPLAYDVWKLERFEKAAWQKADLNLAVSEKDAEVISKATGRECEVIPNGVDLKSFDSFKISKPAEDRPDLLFVGDFNYFTNQDALKFLLRKIWPRVRRDLPAAKLWLVGKNSDSFAGKLKGAGVVVDSRVKDIRQAFYQADLMLVPLRIGSGTSLKVIEAMACGLPVVSTSVGARGLGLKSGREAIIADDPGEFARGVIELMSNRAKRNEIGRAGKRFVKDNLDWQKIGSKLLAAYKELISE